MTLADDLDHIAEHIGDDQDGLPLHSKNTILLAAKALRKPPPPAWAETEQDDESNTR